MIPTYYGVSFSLKQCRNFNIKADECLKFLIEEVGFRRFRLMSYWDEHEKEPENYDFTALDDQINQIEAVNGKVTLCIGARQPRWPESHWPAWALKLPKQAKYKALYSYIEVVVNRYKNRGCIINYQLENEALNRSFGRHGDFNRQRLRNEFQLVKRLDPTRNIIMTTSNTWGIPLRRPRPNLFGFTFYRVQYEKHGYHFSITPWWWYDIRATLIYLLTRRRSFIHELQAEPWGDRAIWEMDQTQQNKSMSLKQLEINLRLASKTKLLPIDLWGGEWWYWRYKQGDDKIFKKVQKLLCSL